MKDYQTILPALPDWVDEEKLSRVLDCYHDGSFELDLPEDGFSETIHGTTYHTVPHYAAEGSEDVLNKLRRIMAQELER